jgi:hypothetical protein
LYKCIECGFTGERPAAAYEKDGSINDVCGHCKSTNIRISEERCSVCGAAIYKGEYAYEAGEMLICGRCVTTVLV